MIQATYLLLQRLSKIGGNTRSTRDSWSVPLRNWTGNKESEERRTKVPYETKLGTLAGRDEVDAARRNLYTTDRS